MIEAEALLEFIEELVYTRKGENFSDLQRTILLTSLQGSRMTYDQLAEDCGYSPKYVKQDIAPKLWLFLSDVLGQKITKSNVRAALERELRKYSQQTSERAGATPQPGVTMPQRSPSFAVPAFLSVPSFEQAPPSSLDLGSNLHQGTILLVDDQPKNLKLLSDFLEEQGYTVQQAINGTVALQAVAIAPPDLILLDIQMPDLDGYTVCQQLKSNPHFQDIPVIFVSALDEAWDKVKAFSVGGSDYISKPFKLVEVLARVENQLKIWRLQQVLKRQNAQLQQAIQELNRLAAIDPVTQVSSRQRFDDYLEASWQQGITTQSPLSIAMCCVGRFSEFNDAYGRAVGDQCLRHIAQLMKKAAQRPEDLVSRYSGVMFAMILVSRDSDEAAAIAEDLLKDFIILSGTPSTADIPCLFLNIGIATAIPDGSSDSSALIERCDRALCEAKSRGSNCFVVG